jgi:hypothetical protein
VTPWREEYATAKPKVTNYADILRDLEMKARSYLPYKVFLFFSEDPPVAEPKRFRFPKTFLSVTCFQASSRFT